ncbi:single-stranded DNA-binding protein [Patescibacteria group bacterium]|nr:single-stranded DNA-binding protein [Patescibacteria group bacterium]
MDLNKAMIIGNVTRDPEIKTTPSGQSVASFAIATNLVWIDQAGQKQQKAEFHNITAWRKLAEVCSQYLKKGSKVYIEGRIETRDWTPQDGIKRYRTEIIADNMIMLDSKGTAQTQSPSPQFGQARAPQAPSKNFAQQNQNFQSATPTISADEPVNHPIDQDRNPQEDEVRIEDIPF